MASFNLGPYLIRIFINLVIFSSKRYKLVVAEVFIDPNLEFQKTIGLF